MMRYLEECGKQWRLKQEKLRWQKQKEEVKKEKEGKKQEEREVKKEEQKMIIMIKESGMINVKKVVEKWEIWDEEKEVVRLEEKAKN